MAKINSEDETLVEVPPVATPVEAMKPKESPSLGLQDIAALLNLVDIASKRGAFAASEMSTVGATFDKVLNFLKATGTVTEQSDNKTDKESKE